MSRSKDHKSEAPSIRTASGLTGDIKLTRQVATERRPPVKSTDLPSCRRRSCNRTGRHEGWCTPHAQGEADRRFSLYIRNRDGGCLVCHRQDLLQCAHLVSREYQLTRYHRANAVCLCSGHHFSFTGHPARWWKWCDEHWPGRIERLEWIGRYGVRRNYQPDFAAAIRKFDEGRWDEIRTARW